MRERGRIIVRQVATELLAVASLLPETFGQVVDLIVPHKASIFITGVGKSGIVGRKMAATFASLGTPAFFLPPVDAVHGDFGNVRTADIVFILTWSGDTEELVSIARMARLIGSTVVTITGDRTGSIGANSDIVLELPPLSEANIFGAPMASTTGMMAVGDALAVCVAERRGFTMDEFRARHPGGALGKR